MADLISTFSINTVMVCRITLNLRTTVYGPTTFERTQNSIPMGEMRSPRSGRWDQMQMLHSTEKDLEVHIRKDYDQSKDYSHSSGFTNNDASTTAHQTAGQGVIEIDAVV